MNKDKMLQKQIKEIKEYQSVVNSCGSIYLKNDYTKKIKRLLKELKEYCFYKGYCFQTLKSNYQI